MILQNSKTIPGQKTLFFKFKEFSRAKVKFKDFFQVCANPALLYRLFLDHDIIFYF